MTALIDEYKSKWGVEPICEVLPIAPSIYPAARRQPPSARAARDEELKLQILGVWDENYRVYAPKGLGPPQPREHPRRLLHRRAADARARDQGRRAGKRYRTTILGGDTDRSASGPHPGRLQRADTEPSVVCDLIYVRTWSGFVYVSFVIDGFAPGASWAGRHRVHCAQISASMHSNKPSGRANEGLD